MWVDIALINVKRISIYIRICISKAKPKVCGNGCTAGVRLRIRRGCNEGVRVQGGPQVRIQGWTVVIEIRKNCCHRHHQKVKFQ